MQAVVDEPRVAPIARAMLSIALRYEDFKYTPSIKNSTLNPLIRSIMIPNVRSGAFSCGKWIKLWEMEPIARAMLSIPLRYEVFK